MQGFKLLHTGDRMHLCVLYVSRKKYSHHLNKCVLLIEAVEEVTSPHSQPRVSLEDLVEVARPLLVHESTVRNLNEGGLTNVILVGRKDPDHFVAGRTILVDCCWVRADPARNDLLHPLVEGPLKRLARWFKGEWDNNRSHVSTNCGARILEGRGWIDDASTSADDVARLLR
jgi:hypothetical protein